MGSYVSSLIGKKDFEYTTSDIPKQNKIIGDNKSQLVLLYRYIGTGYHGLQLNLEEKTIEKDLFIGLINGGILDVNANKSIRRIQWSSASRTDTGVHACAQVVSFVAEGRKGMKLDDIPEMINRNLPKGSTINCLACLQLNRRFYAHRYAGSRIYHYLLPLHTFSSSDTDHLNYLRNQIMTLFIGKNNFHNYTSKVDKNSESAHRVITDFTFSDPFEVDSIDFVLITIRGLSFMLNQIRKMICVVLSASYGQIGPDEVKRTFTLESWRIKKIPGDGLMLSKVEYPNLVKPSKKGKMFPFESDVEFNMFRHEIENWKSKVLFRHIAYLVKKEDMFRKFVKQDLLQSPVSLRVNEK